MGRDRENELKLEISMVFRWGFEVAKARVQRCDGEDAKAKVRS